MSRSNTKWAAKAALLQGAAAAALCVGVQAASAETLVRVLAPTSSGNAFAELAERYMADTPDVNIRVEPVPPGDSYGQALLTQLQAGNGADILFTNGGYGAPESMMPLGEAGRLADLSAAEFAADVPSDKFYEFYDGDKLFGLPLSMLNVGLNANMTEISNLGLEVPKTFAELLDFCKAARENGKSAFAIPGASPFYFLETVAVSVVYGPDAKWDEKREAGEVKFAESDWVEAFNRVEQMKEADCFQPGYAAAPVPQIFAEFASGNALMGVGPSTFQGAVLGLNAGLEIQMFPFPSDTADGTVAIGFFNDALSLNADSQNKEAATAFLNWMGQDAQLAAYSELAGGVPPKEADKGNFPANLAPQGPYVVAGNYRTIPHHAWRDGEVRAVLNSSGNALLAGIKSPEEVAADLDNAWDN